MNIKCKTYFFLTQHKKLKAFIRPLYIAIYVIPLFIKNYIWFQILGILRIIFCDKFRYLKQIKSLKNTNSCDRCFIVASGPSLSKEDVEKLNKYQEVTFCLNSVYKLYNSLNLKPTYYVCADVEYVNKVLIETRNDFFNDKALLNSFTDLSVKNNNIANCKGLIFVPYNRLLHGYRSFLDYHFMFSNNPIYGLFDYYTVTGLAINLAAFIGFKEIYLLGVDCNYMGKSMHLKECETGTENKFSDNYKLYAAYSMKKGYEYLNKQLLKRKIKVYNATRGGSLEVFPRVDFDEIIGK